MQDVLAADPGVDDLLRDLPLAEAGDLRLAGQLAVGAVEIARDLVRFDLNGEPDHVLVGLLDGGLHRSGERTRNSGSEDPPPALVQTDGFDARGTQPNGPAGHPRFPRLVRGIPDPDLDHAVHLANRRQLRPLDLEQRARVG